LQATVLQAPHHGSAASLSPQFLEAVSPEICVISVGGNNDKLPAEQTQTRLSEYKVYRTDRHGTVKFETDGKTVTVTTEMSP
jgi:competence protein ComEC